MALIRMLEDTWLDVLNILSKEYVVKRLRERLRRMVETDGMELITTVAISNVNDAAQDNDD